MLIHVTKRHIDQGERADCRKCPVALAISEAMGEPWEAGADCYWRAGMLSIYLDPRPTFPLPEEAQEFILAFDAQNRDDSLIKPFWFELEILV